MKNVLDCYSTHLQLLSVQPLSYFGLYLPHSREFGRTPQCWWLSAPSPCLLLVQGSCAQMFQKKKKPTVKTSEFEVKKGILIEKAQLEEVGALTASVDSSSFSFPFVYFFFCKSILREPRIQSSFLSSREGRRRRQEVDKGHRQQVPTGFQGRAKFLSFFISS